MPWCNDDTNDSFGKRMDLQRVAIKNRHTCNYDWWENWILYEMFWIARRALGKLDVREVDQYNMKEGQDLKGLADDALEGMTDIEKYPIAVQLMAAHKLLETRTSAVFHTHSEAHEYEYERQFPELFGIDAEPEETPLFEDDDDDCGSVAIATPEEDQQLVLFS